MAKRVQISDDAGATWSTFPGSKAERTNEAGQIKDTILGQNYESNFPGLISWQISTNGIYKGFGGYSAKIMKSGTPTTITDEAAALVSGKTYQITSATKRYLDRLTAVVVKDNAVDKTAEVESIDYLFGRVTFKSSYTPTGPITLSGKYLPMSQIGSAQSWTMTQTANAIDNSVAETVQANGGYKTYEAGLRTVSLSIKGVYKASDDFAALLESRAEMMIEIDPAGNGKSVARGWFRPTTEGQSGDVGALEEMSLTFTLSVPDQENIIFPFSWLHASDSSLNAAIKKALTAWTSGNLIKVNYLADGESGSEGDGIITDVTLSSGMEAMNEFNVKVQGSDAPDVFP